MYEKGILFAITTDSPFNPQQYLPLNAALAHKAGLPELEAIKAITINPAKITAADFEYANATDHTIKLLGRSRAIDDNTAEVMVARYISCVILL